MSKKSDDSIERIFRQAVTQYDITFRESDWLKMEKLLDEEAIRIAAARSKRIRGTAFTLTGLIGLVVAVYFLTFKNPPDSIADVNSEAKEMQAAGDLENKRNVQKETPSDGLLSSTSDSAKAEIESGRTKVPEKISPEESVKNTNKGNQKENNLKEKTSKSPLNISDVFLQEEKDNEPPPNEKFSTLDKIQQRASVVRKGENEITEQNQISAAGRNTSEGLNNINSQHDSSEQDNGEDPDSDISNSSERVSGSSDNDSPISNNRVTENNKPSFQKEISIEDDTHSILRETDSGTVMVDSILTKRSSPNTTDEGVYDPTKSSIANNNGTGLEKDTLTTEEIIKDNKLDSSDSTNEVSVSEGSQKVKPSSRWSVGLVFAPEFSTTRLTRYSSPGESFGLRIGYQISNKFSVNTGLIRSTKKYQDDGSEYSPNPDYWKYRTNGVVPDKINGECLVYEIPFAIQYDVIQASKSRVFVSTAISSYIMQSETYKYNFETPNPGADTEWKSREAESYWFSVGMIAAGYERNIHQSLTIGIEPYLKIALTEIGWSNIKLFSTGAYVTLRYKFITRESRMLSRTD